MGYSIMSNIKVYTRLTENSAGGYKVYKGFHSDLNEAMKILKNEGFYLLNKKDVFSDWSHPSGNTAYIVMDRP